MARDRLTALDGSFLRLESPSAHMHVAWRGVFAPPEGGRPRPTVGALRASIAGRLRHAERFRQRLAFPPGGLSEPVWVDDERFDVRHHVVGMSEPDESLPRARFDELCDLALSTPLDRRRALWRVELAPRLEDGSVGVLMKAHHAMVDGSSAVALALLLLDLVPDAVPATADDGWSPAPAPGAAALAVEALADSGRESLRAASAVARLAASPRRGVRLADMLRRAALAAGEDVLRPAPSSHVNAPIGPRRTLVSHSRALAPLLAARERHGVTLNDVVLTAVSGALRRLDLRAGRTPQPLKVMVPVSMRTVQDAVAPGNRIAFVFVELPVHLHRMRDRLAAIHAATARFKRERRAAGGEAILGALGLLPEPLKDRATRLAAAPRMYNLVVSNVPGPRTPVYLLGCEVREAVPVIPLSEGHALSVGILTHADRITFGGYADPSVLPEVRLLPAALDAAALELEGAPAIRRRRATAAA